MCHTCYDMGWIVEESEVIPNLTRAIACPNPICMAGARMLQGVLVSPGPWLLTAHGEVEGVLVQNSTNETTDCPEKYHCSSR